MAQQAQSRADRLDALIRKVAPKAHEEQAATNRWPIKPEKAEAVEGHRKKLLDPENKDVVHGKRRELVDNKMVERDESTEEHMETYEAPHRGAPYVIDTMANGQCRIRVFSDDGDVYSGVGEDRDAALAALEAKLS